MYAVLCIRRYSFYIFSVQCIHFHYTKLCAIIVDRFCLHTFSCLKNIILKGVGVCFTSVQLYNNIVPSLA